MFHLIIGQPWHRKLRDFNLEITAAGDPAWIGGFFRMPGTFRKGDPEKTEEAVSTGGSPCDIKRRPEIYDEPYKASQTIFE